MQKSSQFNDGIQKELMRAKNINATIMIVRNFLSDGDISSGSDSDNEDDFDMTKSRS